MKRGKRLVAVFVLFATLGWGVPYSYAEQHSITVKIDGREQSFEQPPVSINGRTLVPLRGIFEALGAQVNWDEKTKTAIASKDDITIQIQIGAKKAKRGTEELDLDVPAQIVNSRTMVPIRFISESLGASVVWDQTTKTVLIDTRQVSYEDGKAVIVWADKAKYVGEVKENERSGYGTMTLSDGTKYEGEWAADKSNGKGTLWLPNGTKYEGMWENGQMHGNGILQTNDGTTYEGTWKNGQMDGAFRITLPDGSVIERKFSNGKLVE